jgi:solute carrier family 25 (mitochondrial citrate transporter), member 1
MQASPQIAIATGTQQTTLPIVKSKSKTDPLLSFFAGAVAGGVEAAATYPFEYAKTRAQLRSTTRPMNAFQLMRSTLASEGFAGLYTGCSTLVAGTALKAGVRFFAFDSIKALLVDDNGKLSTSGGIIAGMAAGATESVFAVTPTERIKTALIDDAKGAKRFTSAPHAVGLLLREQGINGLYRGLLSTTMKQSATSAVRMGTYNGLKTQYINRFGHAPNSSIETFAVGAIAGTVTVYATQPFDTIKTRAQSSQGETILVAVRGILQDGGVKAFWRGSSMRLGRLVLSGGIVFSVYEKVLSLTSAMKGSR